MQTKNICDLDSEVCKLCTPVLAPYILIVILHWKFLHMIFGKVLGL